MEALNTIFISYLRVSTERQGSDGLGIDSQRTAISNYLGLTGSSLEAEFVEVESGKRGDRPVLEAALQLCRRRKATLLVAKLDRLSRTVAFLSRLVETRVDFVAVDNPHANKLMVHMLAAFAEHERDMISSRTKAALSAARARGVRLGSPKLDCARAAAAIALRRRADGYCLNVAPVIAEIRRSGISTFAGIASALSARGIPTDRGGQWHAATVRNIERRVKCAVPSVQPVAQSIETQGPQST